MGFLIDRSIVIASARGKLSLSSVITKLGDTPLAISAITASELLHGIYRTQDAQIMQRRREFVEGVFDLLPIMPFDLAVARTHAQLWAQLQASGQMIGAHDLQIGATARTIDYGIITLNEREFKLIPGLLVLNPDALI